MISILIAIPTFIFITFLQTGLISRLPISNGIADIFMITLAVWSLRSTLNESLFWAFISGSILTFISATSFPVYYLSSFFTVLCAMYLRRRILQSPLLATILIVTASCLFFGFINLVQFFIIRLPFDLTNVMETIIIPSLILNLLGTIITFPFIMDLSRWAHGEQLYE